MKPVLWFVMSLALGPSAQAESCHDALAGPSYIREHFPRFFTIDGDVAGWMERTIEGLELIPNDQVAYLFNVLTNQTLKAMLGSMPGRAGIVEEIDPYVGDAWGVHYGFDRNLLLSWRPYQGYKIDIWSGAIAPGSVFVHELGHWITKRLKKDHPEFMRRLRAHFLRKSSALRRSIADSNVPLSPEAFFFTIDDGLLFHYVKIARHSTALPIWKFVERGRIQQRLALFLYYTSFNEYLAYGIQAYFLEPAQTFPLPSGKRLSRANLEREDPQFFRMLADTFR